MAMVTPSESMASCRYDIITIDIAKFLVVYLSLFAGFALAINTLDRAYLRYFYAVENSKEAANFEGSSTACQGEMMSDLTYLLFGLSFGDNLGGTLGLGRENESNSCAGVQVHSLHLRNKA